MINIKIKLNSLSSNQKGIASLLITMIMMIVISIVVLSFAQISRNEQSQVLQQQLSAAAFYAAESGVNDAMAGVVNGSITTQVTNCANSGSFGNSGASSNISYSCVTVNPTPSSLTGVVSNSSAEIFPIHTPGKVDNNAVPGSQLTISWDNKNSTADSTTRGGKFGGCPQYTRGVSGLSGNGFSNLFYTTNITKPAQGVELPTAATWFNPTSNGKICDAGILRVDILPDPGTNFTASNLNAETYFFYPIDCDENSPSGASGTLSPIPCQNTPTLSGYVTYGSGNSGMLVAANCNGVSGGAAPGQASAGHNNGCAVEIGGLTSTDYYIRVQGVYSKPQAVSIYDPSQQFSNAQVQIDSTGVAASVLRRVVVNVPLSYQPGSSIANYPIQSTNSICKQFKWGASSSTLGPDNSSALTPGPDPVAAGVSTSGDCYKYGY